MLSTHNPKSDLKFYVEDLKPGPSSLDHDLRSGSSVCGVEIPGGSEGSIHYFVSLILWSLQHRHDDWPVIIGED